MKYHKPVLLDQSIKGLNIKETGIYVDATFGGGGHSKLILNKLTTGKLYAFDQDISVDKNNIQSENFKLVHTNFRYLKNFLRMEKITKIDGILADLGLSSYQIDNTERGFSFRFDSNLDMRIDVNNELTNTPELINTNPEDSGWYIKIKLEKTNELNNLLNIDQYKKII